MNKAWAPPPPRPPVPFGAVGWAMIALRAPVIAVAVFGGLLVLLACRLIERPLYGMNRPFTPHITRAVCRVTLRIMGLRVTQTGAILRGKGAIVANHTSWLDIFVLNSRKTVYFVSKSEVANWPGIGWLARATGTLFIRRDPRDARAQTKQLEERLLQGQRLLFFPEGTSTDGQRVLPFKTTLFAAFFSDRMRHELMIQSVCVVYHAPKGRIDAFYGWWGDMDFAPSLLELLAQPRQGHVELIYNKPVPVDRFPNRKSLASYLETELREAHERARIAK